MEHVGYGLSLDSAGKCMWYSHDILVGCVASSGTESTLLNCRNGHERFRSLSYSRYLLGCCVDHVGLVVVLLVGHGVRTLFSLSKEE